MKNRARILVILAFPIILTAPFALIEGYSSLAYVLREISAAPRPAEREHTIYDSELGWVNEPNVSIPDFYGPDLDLTINAQGFRGTESFTKNIPPKMFRIICLGDSYTLGYGVDDKSTWCERLKSYLPKVQTVNMGQGGYGLDQSYLWYKREGSKLDHSLVLMGVTDGIRRLESNTFAGFGKPNFELNREGKLELKNVPVPRETMLPRMSVLKALDKLRLLQFFFIDRAFIKSILPTTVPTAVELLKSMKAIATNKGSMFSVVFLANERTLKAYSNDPLEPKWRSQLAGELEKAGIMVEDLHMPLSMIDEDHRKDLFIAEPGPFETSKGHYSELGNDLVAQKIVADLQLDQKVKIGSK